MSCRVTLSIGGYFETIEQANAFADALVSESLNDDEGANIETVKQAQAVMRRAIEGKTSLDLTETIHESGGNFYDIDPVLEGNPSLQKMVYYHSESGADTIERSQFVDGAQKFTSVDYYEYSGALISSREIKVALASDTPIDSIKVLLAVTELQTGSDFPPLTASPAVQVWLKIFGSKVA